MKRRLFLLEFDERSPLTLQRSNVNDHFSKKFKSVVRLAKTMKFDQVRFSKPKKTDIKMGFKKKRKKITLNDTHTKDILLGIYPCPRFYEGKKG